MINPTDKDIGRSVVRIRTDIGDPGSGFEMDVAYFGTLLQIDGPFRGTDPSPPDRKYGKWVWVRFGPHDYWSFSGVFSCPVNTLEWAD